MHMAGSSYGTRSALLIPGQFAGSPGGATMRWRALWLAMRQLGPTNIAEIPCDLMDGCQSACLFTGAPHEPPSSFYYDSKYCPAYADELIDRFTTAGVSRVVCTGLEAYPYVLRLAASPQLDVVFDMHNVQAALHQALIASAPPRSRFEAWYNDSETAAVRRAEGAAMQAADEVWTCSEDDRDLLASTYPEIRADAINVKVVPNAVEVPDAEPEPTEPRRIVFTGLLRYYPNVEAARELIEQMAPILSKRECRLPVVIAGADPDDALTGQRLPGNVTLITDPPDVTDLIRNGIMVVPLRNGGGSRFKILEAFALGAPVISTAKGAEGLQVVPGHHYVQAEDAEAFATAILDVVSDKVHRQRLVSAGWELVQDRYSITALCKYLNNTLLGTPAGDG